MAVLLKKYKNKITINITSKSILAYTLCKCWSQQLIKTALTYAVCIKDYSCNTEIPITDYVTKRFPVIFFLKLIKIKYLKHILVIYSGISQFLYYFCFHLPNKNLVEFSDFF